MDSASLNIAVLFSPKPHQEKQLMDAASGAQLFFLSPESVNADRLADMDIILGNPPPSFLRDCCHLRLLQLQSAGADAYLPAGILPAGTILCNAAGAYGLSLSEYMMAILLELFRKTHLYRDNQRKGIWKNEGPVRSIWNSTVLIVGLGDIGREFSRRLKAFGATVIGVRRRKLPKPDWLDEMYQIEALDSLLPRADVVALCLPATPETAGLMDRRRLSLMKQGAVLLNVGRGSAVDTDALVEALQSGHL